MTVITVSRQYGSGGDEIVETICQQLGYHSFDRRAIAKSAFDVGLTDSDVLDFSDESHQMQKFFDRLLNRSKTVGKVRVWRENTVGVRVVDEEAIDEAQVVTLVEGAIRAAYKDRRMIIVGRGGQAVLADKPEVLHVRIEAPFALRVQRVTEKENMGWQPAEEHVRKRDAAAADYLRCYYDVDWSSPSLYHMILNTGKLSLDTAAELIIKAVTLMDKARSPEGRPPAQP